MFDGNVYLWLKALHIIAVIAWMAGLLYLPRLFVYHAEAEPGSELSETLKIMERRLLRAIMNPAMLVALAVGGVLLTYQDFSDGWLHVKLVCIAGLMVIAFEPNPKMYRILAAALPDNAEARQIALSDCAGTAMLEVPQRNGGWSNQHASLNPHRNEGLDVGKVEVEMCPLNSLDLPPVGFIKIDVEGHEKAVIAGAKGLIERDKPRLIVELEERHTGQPIREAVAEIEALGYEAFFLRAGALQRISEFVPERDHLGVEDTPVYVNNFIFLPR